MLRMHGGGLYVSHESYHSAYSGMVQLEMPRLRPIGRDVGIKANYVRVMSVSGVSICRDATLPDIRVVAAVVSPVSRGYES